MKKYLFGLFAVVLAIGASSFTSNNEKKAKNPASYTFVFTGNDAVSGQVSNLKKWIDINDVDPGCPGGGIEYACKITVSEMFTHPEGDFRVLNTPLNNPWWGLILIIPETYTYSAERYRVDESVALYIDVVDNADGN